MNETITIRQGLFEEDIQIYHETKAISSTLFRTYLKSPVRFFYEWNNWDNRVSEKNDAFKMGSAFHCQILESEEYSNRFVVGPEFNLRSKEGKEQFKAFSQLHEGKEILNNEEEKILEQMRLAFERSFLSKELIGDTEREQSARVKLSNGLFVQCRPDAIKDNHIIDLKTCADSTKFKYEIYSYGYHIQAAYYWWLLSQIDRERFYEADFYFISVEKKPPYEVTVHAIRNATLLRISEETIKPGLIALGKFLQEPSYEEEIQWWELK